MLKKIKRSLGGFLGVTGRSFHCPVCKKDNVVFKPLSFDYLKQLHENQFVFSIFQYETLNIEKYRCSNCSASDRDRLYALYFDQVVSNEQLNVLDLAPSAALTAYFRALPNISVRTADLYMPGVDDVVDVTNMDIYCDETYDAFVCSHVLEHIDDDISAMSEFYRVLKKGGWGIAMVPIHLGLSEVYENDNIKDDLGRWKHFGQNDHVRIYSKDGFISRLQAVGFTVEQLDVSHFGIDLFETCGVHSRSVLYIVKK